MVQAGVKAVLQYRASAGFRAQLEAARPSWLSLAIVEETDRDGFAREMRDAEVLLHVLEPVTGTVMASAPRLRLIQKIGVGVNTIDVDTAKTRGIAVCNMPGSNSQAVAEATLLLMLATLRRLTVLDAMTRAGAGWQLPMDSFDGMGEIGGRTVGLVGYGDVPRRLAPALRALGADIVYTARSEKPDALGRWRSLDALLSMSDIVSLHVPLTPETAGLLSPARLAAMKPGAVLVNTARGGLVDEPALVEALRGGHLRGAGLDVFAAEPTGAGNPLFGMDNVVVAPHVAWLTPETLARSIHVAMDNCARLRSGEALVHRVA